MSRATKGEEVTKYNVEVRLEAYGSMAVEVEAKTEEEASAIALARLDAQREAGKFKFPTVDWGDFEEDRWYSTMIPDSGDFSVYDTEVFEKEDVL